MRPEKRTTAVEIRGLGKMFGSVAALDGIDLDINVGEVLGLVGQNGSGKSTLLKILAGLEVPDCGTIKVHGEKAALRSASSALAHGIGMVHQEQSLLPNLTVAENIFLDKPHSAKRGGIYRWRALCEAARRQMDKINVAIPPMQRIDELRFAERQQVELAKVLAVEEMVSRPPIILLDEPTSILAPEEIERLFHQVRRLRSYAAIVFVSHRIDEILALCDRVVVMTDGEKMADRYVDQLDREELYHLMVGRHRVVGSRTSRTSELTATSRLKVRGLCVASHVRDVSLDVRPGQIIGLAGVVGSGAEELCRAIFGAEMEVSGDIWLNERRVVARSPAEAMAHGIAYLPANRRAEGMFKGQSLLQNMVVAYGLDYSKRWVAVDRGAEERAARDWLDRLKVKAAGPWALMDALSGGNQQKVVLGKWLMARHLQLLLLDHPTRGLDPGARDELFDAIRGEARKGLAIILVGDTIAEMLELADNLIVMKDGAVTARFDLLSGAMPPEEEVVRAMV